MWNKLHKIHDPMAQDHDSINSITKLTSISCLDTEKSMFAENNGMNRTKKKIQRKTI